MKRLYIFIFLVGLLGNNIMYAQIPASSQSLPSPNVAALGLYGEIPVSKFTGMPDISVPIYEVPLNCRFLSIIMPPGYVLTNIRDG